MTLKHLTSSVFVFRRFADGWRTGLIRHPRLHKMMIPGGHVEPDESAAEAALREVAEETGLAVTLVSPPAAPVPAGYRGRRVALPWWIAEYEVKSDNHLDVAHIHVDHLYVALADGTPPAAGTGQPDAAHQFGWYAPGDLPGLDMYDDARLLARLLLNGLTTGPDGPAARANGPAADANRLDAEVDGTDAAMDGADAAAVAALLAGLGEAAPDPQPTEL